MTPDEMHAKHFTPDYNRGFKAGEKHRKSSQPTLDQFKNMNDEITTIKVTQAKHSNELSHIKENGEDMKNTMKDFIERVDKYYARKENVTELNKRVSKVIWASGTALVSSLSAIIVFLINFIISKK